jgi:hypothetical protein
VGTGAAAVADAVSGAFFLALTNYLGDKVLDGCNSFVSLGKQLVTFIIHALLTLLFSRLLAGTPRGRELFGLRRLTTKLLQANARFRVPSQTRRYFSHCSEQKKDRFYKKKLHHRQNNNMDGNEVGEVSPILAHFGTPLTCRLGLFRRHGQLQQSSSRESLFYGFKPHSVIDIAL